MESETVLKKGVLFFGITTDGVILLCMQSSVFMKQLAFDLLELLLLSSFPELDYVFRELDRDKEKFGKLA